MVKKFLKWLLKELIECLSYAAALYFIGACMGAGFAMGILIATTKW